MKPKPSSSKTKQDEYLEGITNRDQRPLTRQRPHSSHIEAQMRSALLEIGERYGMELHISSNKISDTGVSFFCSLSDPSARKEEFAALAPVFGLKPEDFNRTFTMLGKRYRIKALMPSRSKHPVLAEREDGRRFKFSAPTVKGLLSTTK